MPAIMITGSTSKIAEHVRQSLPVGYKSLDITRNVCDLSDLDGIWCLEEYIRASEGIVLAHGTCTGPAFLQRSSKNILDSMSVNLLSTVKICEIALHVNPSVKIVIIGSESGEKGSFDIPYWFAKTSLVSYVQERRINHPDQRLVCINPGMLEDGRMTQGKSPRKIQEYIEQSGQKRLMTSKEVAAWVEFVLFGDGCYPTNYVIDLYRGNTARFSY